MGYAPAMAAVGSGGESRVAPAEVVTGNYFRVLGVPVARGRALSPDDDRPGAAPVVVISDAFWSAGSTPIRAPSDGRSGSAPGRTPSWGWRPRALAA